jgi:hypothetical protein
MSLTEPTRCSMCDQSEIVILPGAASVSDNADRHRVIAEELFAWGEMIIALLDRMILAVPIHAIGGRQRRQLSRRAQKVEALFIGIGDILEIEGETDLLSEELANHIDRLSEMIANTHAIIDRLIESETS